MCNILLFILLCGAPLIQVLAQDAIQRGAFPFMGFIYYSDESIVDNNGNRFMHSAVLLRPDWLISASIDPFSYSDVILGFPRKTLLARFGVVSVDSKITLGEDEDEQEKEVVQLIRPAEHNETVFWRSDITLLKTLGAFTLTTFVAVAPIYTKHNIGQNSCKMLLFVKKIKTEDKILIQLAVDLLPPNLENCGQNFDENFMTCGKTPDAIVTNLPPDYCAGNAGGPLICEREVSGIQTYGDSCKQPHLFHSLSKWSSFLDCGMNEQCQKEPCRKICTVTNKDEEMVESAEITNEMNPTSTDIVTTASYKVTSPESHSFEVASTSVVAVTASTELEEDTTRAKEDATVNPEIDSTVKRAQSVEPTKTTVKVSSSVKTRSKSKEVKQSWVMKVKSKTTSIKPVEESEQKTTESAERNPQVEAQVEETKETRRKGRSSSPGWISSFYTIVISISLTAIIL